MKTNSKNLSINLIFERSFIVPFTLCLILAGCGGGSSGSSVPHTPAVSSEPILGKVEQTTVRDDPEVYAVENSSQVINASITTIDGAYTFDQVNADTDAYDDFVPEVDARFTADDYPYAGLSANAKLRQRGKTSRLAPQKSYRLKLNKSAVPWRGEVTLQLNKHPWDLTRIRNKLAFDLFRDIPHLPSLRTQFMHLTVNGEDYGLFTHVEKMGKEYLAKRGLPTDGNIYKANNFEFREVSALTLDQNGYPADLDAFELVLELENDNKNHTQLKEMVEAVNDENRAFDTLFNTYFDRDNYLAWLATNILIGNFDTINQNFALYQPKDSTKFFFLPWDYDGSFGQEDQPDFARNNNLYAPWQLGVGNWWWVPLHRRFMQDPVHLDELRRAVEEIYGTYLTNAKIKALLDQYKNIVEPLILSSPDFDNLPTVTASRQEKEAEWAGEYDRLVTTIAKNYQYFKSSLEKPMPFWQGAAIIIENGTEKLQLTWDQAVDLQNDGVSYTIRVADNPQFNPALFSDSGYTGHSLTIAKPHKGIYYMQVIAKDSKGNMSGAFERFDQGMTPFYGVKRFEVQ